MRKKIIALAYLANYHYSQWIAVRLVRITNFQPLFEAINYTVTVHEYLLTPCTNVSNPLHGKVFMDVLMQEPIEMMPKGKCWKVHYMLINCQGMHSLP